MKGKIKIGAGIFQDHHFGKWPNCCPPAKEYKGEVYEYQARNPDMLFEVEWTGGHWDCRADGYGHLSSNGDTGEYGNGSIFVKDRDGVDIVGSNVKVRGDTPQAERPS